MLLRWRFSPVILKNHTKNMTASWHLVSVQYILRWTQSIASPSGASRSSETRTSLEPPWKSIRSIVLWLAKYTFKMYGDGARAQQFYIVMKNTTTNNKHNNGIFLENVERVKLKQFQASSVVQRPVWMDEWVGEWVWPLTNSCFRILSTRCQ